MPGGFVAELTQKGCCSHSVPVKATLGSLFIPRGGDGAPCTSPAALARARSGPLCVHETRVRCARDCKMQASLQYAKESILLKVLQDVADNDKRTQTLDLCSSVVWKGKSATLMSSLADALRNNTKVTAINLSDCNIGDNALCSLANSIKENGTVRVAASPPPGRPRARG